ncbi:hypothetical protein ACFWN7_00810 [Agromyces sp. NPDC058484]|uniref:hypothetical protein n=1 Tax=Agromyces sp. NPDC058484 TaxID=3346524 RepID=UPI003663446D
MHTLRTFGASILVALAGVLLATAAAGSASARPASAPAPPSLQSWNPARCPLERIGEQLVRCDVLTGTGVRAPLSIPQQL